MPSLFSFDRVSFSYPQRRVLTDVSFTVTPGRVAGLIGENGAGKSTLLSLLTGVHPDAGTIVVPERVGFIEQETSLPHHAPARLLIDAAVDEVRQLERDIEDLSAEMATRDVADEFDLALARAEQAQLWSLDARIAQVLDGLGLGTVDLGTAIGEMSGGQRRRFALAALLIRPSDGLLLDEPTNHLDDAGVDFLISELTAFSGPVIAASHDRWFLDHCATDIIDLDPALGAEGGYGEDTRQAALFTGSFSEYLSWRTAARRRWEHDYAAQERTREELSNKLGLTEGDIFHSTEAKSGTRKAAKFYADRAAKTVGNRIKSARSRLEELDRFAIPAPPPRLSFEFTQAASAMETSEPLLSVRNVSVSGRLASTTVELFAGQSLLVEGPNGTGKSTFLQLVAGCLPTFDGERIVHDDARIGYLPQDIEWPAMAATPASLCPDLVALGLLGEDHMNTPLRQLSLGQQRRVAIGMVLADPPEILILDEPTNHIALTLAEDLEAALSDYPGVCLIATHDRWLRSRWQEKRLHFSEGS